MTAGVTAGVNAGVTLGVTLGDTAGKALAQQLQGGGVGPLQVVDDEHRCQPRQQAGQRRQCARQGVVSRRQQFTIGQRRQQPREVAALCGAGQQSAHALHLPVQGLQHRQQRRGLQAVAALQPQRCRRRKGLGQQA